MIRPVIVPLDQPIAEELAQEWRNVIAEAGGSFFQTPDWISAWAATAGRDQESIAAIWRVNGSIKAIVTLARGIERLHSRSPLTVRYWTNAGTGRGSADHAGWTIDETLERDVANWLRLHIGRDTLLLRNVADLPRFLNEAFLWLEVDETRCPRLNPHAYVAGEIGSDRLRKTIRNGRRRLTDVGVELDWYPAGRVTHQTLDDLFQLHGDRRDMVGDTSSFLSREMYALHQRMVGDARTNAGAVAVVASVDDRKIGVLYGFVIGSVFSYFQSGWDANFSSMSMGSVLVDEAIHRAAECDYEVFDFLRGPEPYKYRFGAEDVVDRSLLSGRGISARLIRLKYAARQRRSRASARFGQVP